MAETLEHLQVVEIETKTGYRFRTGAMAQAEITDFLKDEEEMGSSLSDIECSINCPACNEG